MTSPEPRRLALHAAALVALIAAVPQLVAHLTDLRSGAPPGSEYTPRVKAILDTSRVAASGGPSLAVPTKDGRFEPVEPRVNDLGAAVVAFSVARVTGRPASRRTLLALNMMLFVAGVAILVGVTPGWHRAALAIPFLLTPLVETAYRSADPLASHGALAALGIGIAAAGSRARPAGQAVLLGALLFIAHKVRSAYALYTIAALVLGAGVSLLRTRDKVLRTLVFLALGFAALEVPWRLWLAERAKDPRLSRRDTLGSHPIWIALLEGVGWSRETGAYGPPNRWGLRPYDPWVATHLAERYGVEPVDVGSAESERRSRRRYLELWREDPLHLAAVYAGRLPDALVAHTPGAGLGLAALLLLAPFAVALAWRDRNLRLLTLLISATGMWIGVAFQTVALDPRLLYAYPLRPISLIVLSLSASSVFGAWRAQRLHSSK